MPTDGAGSNTPQVNAVIEELQRLQLSQDNARQPHTRIRDAADTVLVFDGRNITIHKCSKCCRNAKGMIAPNAEYGLVQLIKCKLTGQASRVILNGDYNTIEKIIKVLSSHFAPLHSSIQLCGEMSKIAQFPNEATVYYSSRVSGILLQLRYCNEIEVPLHVAQYNQSAEANSIKAFLTELQPEIYARIRTVEFTDLDSAISTAIKAEAECQENIMRNKFAEGLSHSVQCANCFGYGHSATECSSKYSGGQIAQISWRSKYCNHCRKVGHTVQECRNVNTKPRSAQNNSGSPTTSRNSATRQSQQIECRYCKNYGHTIQECRKKMYNDKRRSAESPNPKQQTPNSSQNPVRSQAVLKLRISETWRAPSLALSSPDFKQNRVIMKIDTGADLSVIKEGAVSPGTQIFTDITYNLSGITEGSLDTIGYIKTNILNTTAVIHVVKTLPTAQDGILGSDFFHCNGAVIDYSRLGITIGSELLPFKNVEIKIPARMRYQIPIKILNQGLQTGYVPKLNVHPKILMGNAIVTNDDGIGYLYAINTSSNDIKIKIPSVEIEPYEEVKFEEEIESPEHVR